MAEYFSVYNQRYQYVESFDQIPKKELAAMTEEERDRLQVHFNSKED